MSESTPKVSPRKRPMQSRSKKTVSAILEATTRVLIDEGYEKANTNRIAEVAGVSVGTLYQYFPNKESLVMAVLEEHSEEMISLLRLSTKDMASDPIPVAVRSYVKAMLQTHYLNPTLHKALFHQVMHLGIEHIQHYQSVAEEIVKSYLMIHKDDILPKNLDLAAFILVTSVESITHTAVLEHVRYLKDREGLAEEISAFVLRYLLGSNAD